MKKGKEAAMKEILVIGCGPAGMMAAIWAARQGNRVTILEGMDRPGKKLLLTGNGKCNLTNQDPELVKRYHGAPVGEVLAQFSTGDTLDFFHSIGLMTADKNGCVYPYTGQSSSVLELLLAELKRLGVKLKFSEKIIRISGENETLAASTQSWSYRADRIILACGSRALPSTGSDGTGYLLAKQAGHSILPVLPALTSLQAGEKWIAACAGVRCPARVSIFLENTSSPAAAETGELQWTEYGISGIVVFQISRFASLALQRKQKVFVKLDLFPQMPEEELLSWLLQIGQNALETSISGAFSGILPKKLLTALLKEQGINPKTAMKQLSKQQLRDFTALAKEIRLTITGTKSFDQCQVCTGGVPMCEVTPDTLESRRMSGLYLAGELLDVDGPCGGYNLQWAWSSGYAAGFHAGS
ncbi:MAG: NAD(P)/FAD-dependent oxidoreductase [Lachnospiraceae bacterium]|nr:NAD(P)/FAD-dependent oxidoreductase [Lachnospiraceae bacterium]